MNSTYYHVLSSGDRARARGFSAIEILSVIAVAGIIGFSAPSVIEALNAKRQTAAIDDFSTMVSYAREQALARQTSVSLCIANDTGDDCAANSKNWGKGYLVKVDDSGQVLKTQTKLPETLSIISGDSRAIHFSGNGLINEARVFKFCDDSRSNGTIRNIIINNGSQVRMANFTQEGRCTS